MKITSPSFLLDMLVSLLRTGAVVFECSRMKVDVPGLSKVNNSRSMLRLLVNPETEWRSGVYLRNK